MLKCSANLDRLRGYKIEIYPSEEQKNQIIEIINAYRFCHNLAIDIIQRRYEEDKIYTKYIDMCKIIAKIQKSGEYPWLQCISIGILREALRDVDHAYKNFFNNPRHFGFPKYKTKKRSKMIFRTRSDRCTILDNGYIGISGFGRVYAAKHPIPKTRLYNTQVTYDRHGRFYFSCQVESPYINKLNIPKTQPIGIDVGVRNMITASNGNVYHFSDISKYTKRLRRQEKRATRYRSRYLEQSIRTTTKYEDIPKSKNMQKHSDKLFKTYRKISNKRMNDIHNATKDIFSCNPSAVVIENISVRELQKDKWFNRLPQSYFYEIHRQIKYKAADRGIPVIIADHNFPSSQICSNCGFQHKIYGNKKFICPNCGLRIDRDLNAAYNLRNLAYQNNSTY